MELINGDRRHIKIQDGVMANFHLTKSDFIFIKQFKYLHTDYFGRVYGMLEFFQSENIKTIFDFSTFIDDKDIELILPFVNVGLFSINAINKKTKEMMKNFQKKGTDMIIATAGSIGAIVYDGKKYYVKSAKKVSRVINTAGAGDAFLAGFLKKSMRNLDIEESILSAMETASIVVQSFNPY